MASASEELFSQDCPYKKNKHSLSEDVKWMVDLLAHRVLRAAYISSDRRNSRRCTDGISNSTRCSCALVTIYCIDCKIFSLYRECRVIIYKKKLEKILVKDAKHVSMTNELNIFLLNLLFPCLLFWLAFCPA